MSLRQAFQIFMSYFAVEREKIAAQKAEEIAKFENLDIFLEAEEHCQPGEVMYCTVHGFRSLDFERCHLNQFVVTNKGIGFSKARNLPYIYLPVTKCEPPQLIVECPCIQATAAGYATAIRLPYAIIGKIDEYPEGTMIVCITEDSEASVDSGYANAVPLPFDRDSVYIEKLNMLDTDYAAMLVNFPRA